MSTMGDTTKEMATFLRTRRERLAPGDVGLPDRRRARRTPGLRREEVAELAGVSVDYVVRLEQGRGLRPSPDVLDALAGALRLSDDERAYLFDLARQRQAGRQRKTEVAIQLVQLLGDLSPLPAMVVNHRNDILAWNTEMTRLMMIDFDEVPEEQRNGLWLCLLHPTLSTFYLDREEIIREGIADLRAAWATHPDDDSFAQFVDELTARSEEFARYWAQQDVQVRGRGCKRMVHAAGLVSVHFEVLTSLQDPDQRLIVYRAADPDSQKALAAITAAE